MIAARPITIGSTMRTRSDLAPLPSGPLAAALVAHAPGDPQAERHLHGVIAGMTVRPGRLLRARLVLTAAAAQNLSDDVALRLATAVEYFHLSSLLLDDLPCMDDAQLRRGQPCAHRVHGEAAAILGALAFINRGYALVGGVFASTGGEPAAQAQVELDRCLGAAGLVGGQARDLAFADGVRSPREVGRVAVGKTAAMLVLALRLPVLAAGAGDEEMNTLRALGLYWGLAFQALDDLGDALTTTVVSGKTTGRDRALGRPSFALVLGVPATRRRIARWLALADAGIERLVAGRAGWARLREFQHEFKLAAASMTRSDNRAAA